ncbi:MAG: hypothetical protein AB7F86_12860 [Bdellovibrionales bacterium]
MTTTTYKYGKHTCKAYKKTVGKGWEVGFTFGSTQIFVGNFIHTKEANAWWTMMNTEVKKFGRRYALPKNASATFFSKFLSNYIYKAYYTFLDRQFTKYNRTYTQACKKFERRASTMKRNWPTGMERHMIRKTA